MAIEIPKKFIYTPKVDVETTFVMEKPDCYNNKYTGEVINRLLQFGFKIKYMNMGWLNDEILDKLYIGVQDQNFFPNMAVFLKSAPIVAMIIEGKDAITNGKIYRGPTSASEIIPGTIRELRERPLDSSNYDIALNYKNIIHWSLTREEAEKDLKIVINNMKNAEENFDTTTETNHFIINPVCYMNDLIGIIIDEFCKRGKITTLQMGYLRREILKELYPNINDEFFYEYMQVAPLISLTLQGDGVVTKTKEIITSIENSNRIKISKSILEEYMQCGLKGLITGEDSLSWGEDSYKLLRKNIIFK